jgi:hypothetical protein
MTRAAETVPTFADNGAVSSDNHCANHRVWRSEAHAMTRQLKSASHIIRVYIHFRKNNITAARGRSTSNICQKPNFRTMQRYDKVLKKTTETDSHHPPPITTNFH